MEHEWQVILMPGGLSNGPEPGLSYPTLGVKRKEGKGYRGAYAILEAPMTDSDRRYIIEILQRNAVPLTEGTEPAPLFKW